MNSKIIIKSVALILLLLFKVEASFSCGPQIPYTVLDTPQRIEAPPAFSFRYLIHDWVRAQRAEFNYIESDTAQIDLKELRISLIKSEGVDNKQLEDIVSAYEKIRTNLPLDDDTSENKYKTIINSIPLKETNVFHLYLKGAAAYYHKYYDKAAQSWQKLIQLESGQQPALRIRTNWAMYMIAKTYFETEKYKEASEACQKLRALVSSGCPDTIGLANASLGLEARANLRLKNNTKAIDLYFKQYLGQDPLALNSLRVAISRLLLSNNPKEYDKAATDDRIAPLISAYIASSIYNSYALTPWESIDLADDIEATDSTKQACINQWFRALKRRNKNIGMPLFALAAYKSGDIKSAKKWLNESDADSLIAKWLTVKFHLRNGDLESAASLLSSFIKDLDGHQKKKAYTTLSLIHIARQEYIQCLDVLLKNGWWWDASYVAERILTTEELKSYVDNQLQSLNAGQIVAPYYLGADEEEEEVAGESNNSTWIVFKLRYLLARRYIREGLYNAAKIYLPEDIVPMLDELISCSNMAESAMDETDRADTLWRKAQSIRNYGWKLMASEIDPDWLLYDCVYSFNFKTSCYTARKQYKKHPTKWTSTDEYQRLIKHTLSHEDRFHYRYIAADLAWEAAQKMPDNSEKTANVLFKAGSWIKNDDTRYADKFYKALVTRCANTTLGKKARKLNWFPQLPDAE